MRLTHNRILSTATPLARAALACVGALALSAAAFAQSDSPRADEDLPLFEGGDADVTDGGREFRFIFGGGYTTSFETDIDTGGDFSVDRLTAGLNVATDLNRDCTLEFRLNAGLASYDFGGEGGIGAGFGGLDPWHDVQAIAFGAAAAWQIDDDWGVFGGPLFQFARESGADWGDAFTFGGIAGVTYKFTDKFVIGGGFGVMTQIEDSVRFFPLIIVQWNFAENWRITNTGPSGGRSSIELTGLELVWNPAKKWEFALGAGSSYARFRLDDDDDAAAPDGVGEDESIPVWLRATWKPTPTISLDAVAGIAFGGELHLDDSDGDGIANSDYDMPLSVGVFGSIRF